MSHDFGPVDHWNLSWAQILNSELCWGVKRSWEFSTPTPTWRRRRVVLPGPTMSHRNHSNQWDEREKFIDMKGTHFDFKTKLGNGQLSTHSPPTEHRQFQYNQDDLCWNGCNWNAAGSVGTPVIFFTESDHLQCPTHPLLSTPAKVSSSSWLSPSPSSSSPSVASS